MAPFSRDGSDAAGNGGPRDPSHVQLISDAITRAYKAQYGKGPETMRVHITGDTVVALLRGGYSIVEESLHQAGQSTAVRDQRRAFADMIAPTLSTAIAEITDREVVAVLADTCQDPDLGAIVLVLADRASDVPRVRSEVPGYVAPGTCEVHG